MRNWKKNKEDELIEEIKCHEWVEVIEGGRMNEKVKRILTEVKKYLIESFGDKIRQVILYGSYARGDYNKDSDIDILIVVSDNVNPVEVEEFLSDLLFEILLNENELCSVRAIPEKLFKEYNSPFLLNVKEEGVVI